MWRTMAYGVALFCASPALGMTQDQCRELAPLVANAFASSRDMANSMKELNLRTLLPDLDGPVLSAVNKVMDAQPSAVAAFELYLDAADQLTAALFACAATAE